MINGDGYTLEPKNYIIQTTVGDDTGCVFGIMEMYLPP